MSEPSVRRHADAAALAGEVASALLARLEEAQGRGETPQIGLTGGTIADAIHRELAHQAPAASVDWSKVVFWWGDERWLPAGSPDRNEVQARNAFLSQVGAQHIHPMPASDAGMSLSQAALAYGEEIREFGSGFFEVLMLGIGPDGHVASLFPGHPAAAVTDAIVVPVQESPKPPPERLSLTFEAMERSRAVWFVASGAEKADAVSQALAITEAAQSESRLPRASEVRQIPASGVRGEIETVWWLDEPLTRHLSADPGDSPVT